MPKTITNFTDNYAFLSNYYKHNLITDIDYPDIKYPTVEHAFQAAKTLNRSERMRFSELVTPSEAKLAGRHVKLREDWEDIKLDIMKHYLKEKFSIPELRELLLATEDAILVEGNTWHDNFWGDCHCSQCKNRIGYNNLGQLLIQIREEIKED